MVDPAIIEFLFLYLVPVSILSVIIGVVTRVVGLFAEKKKVEMAGMVLTGLGLLMFVGFVLVWSEFVVETVIATNQTALIDTTAQTCHWVNNSTSSCLVCEKWEL